MLGLVLPPLAALVLFAVWALVLVLSIGAWRIVEVVGGKAIGGFPSGTKHGSDLYWRLNRAHMNTVENLPMFGVLVLAGLFLQVQHWSLALLASIILYARVAQSLIQIASGSTLAVSLRFTAYVIQVASMFAMAGPILRATGLPLPW